MIVSREYFSHDRSLGDDRTVEMIPRGRQALMFSCLDMRRVRVRIRWEMRVRNRVGTNPETCNILRNTEKIGWCALTSDTPP